MAFFKECRSKYALSIPDMGVYEEMLVTQPGTDFVGCRVRPTSKGGLNEGRTVDQVSDGLRVRRSSNAPHGSPFPFRSATLRLPPAPPSPYGAECLALRVKAPLHG